MKTIIHYYWLDISRAVDKEDYTKLCNKLKGIGLKKFDSISPNQSTNYKKMIKPLDNTEIELETNCLFNNQWNTAPVLTSQIGLRVFDWAEAIYPNRNVREGQWLEQTEEMKEIRRNIFKCTFCGNSYKLEDLPNKYHLCEHCINSPWLDFEGEGKLLRLYSVDTSSKDKKYPELTSEERNYLLSLRKGV